MKIVKVIKTIKIGKRIEIRIYPKKSKYQELERNNFYLKHIPDRKTAKEILKDMKEIINMYGAVSVADAYDLVGLASEYPDDMYGWCDLSRDCTILLTSDFEYMLRLPKIKRIKY